MKNKSMCFSRLIILTCLLSVSVSGVLVSCASIDIGVRVGDWVKYEVHGNVPQITDYESVAFVVYDQSAGFATGGGWIIPGGVSAWWDTNWKYRRLFVVTEQSGDDLFNYSVSVSFNTAAEISAGDMNPDCSDIRVVNASSGKVLDFSVQDPNSANTVITAKVNATAFGSATDIYIYYGNPAATAVDKPFNEVYYEFWDDFTGADGSDPDTTKWIEETWAAYPGDPYTGGDSQIKDNMVQIKVAYDWQKVGLYTIKNFPTDQGWEFSVDMWRTGANSYGNGFVMNSSLAPPELGLFYAETFIFWQGNAYYVTTKDFRKCNTTSFPGWGFTFGSYPLTTGWHTYKVVMDYHNNEISAYQDDVLVGSTDYSGFNPHSLKFVMTASADVGSIFYADKVRARAYTVQEPTASLGFEETEPVSLDEYKATFGFVAKYNKDSTTPNGNLEFQYHHNDMNLKSTEITWLVIPNIKALFQGTATINGLGLYTFRVEATDGDQTGEQPDHFYIKVWQGTDTEADPIHSYRGDLVGGNIKIHKKQLRNISSFFFS